MFRKIILINLTRLITFRHSLNIDLVTFCVIVGGKKILKLDFVEM